MHYQYRGPGAPAGLTAQETGDELTRIYETRGELTPPAIVDESRPLEAILHRAFEWDDPTAAERYREQQARQIVRAVVLIPSPRETVPEIRAFVSIHKPEQDKQRTYKPILEVMQKPEELEEIKRRWRNEVLALRRRYQDILDAEEMMSQAATVLGAGAA